jgi:hypothetical protein
MRRTFKVERGPTWRIDPKAVACVGGFPETPWYEFLLLGTPADGVVGWSLGSAGRTEVIICTPPRLPRGLKERLLVFDVS